ncbi:MAG: phage tail assembly protein [Chloroflexota bacterium]|nr:phage tail assembly protein [Chloroflexota bacterium]
MSIQTKFEFTLPCGYVDERGNVHRQGVMRLATAMDEIAPLRDPRVRANQAYLIIILLSRVIVKLGILSEITPSIVEKLFAADLTYLQELYRQINEQGVSDIPATCPVCGAQFELDLADLAGES